MKLNSILLSFSFLVLLIGFNSCDETKPVQVKKNVQYVSGADEVTYLKLGKEIVDTIGYKLKTNLVKAMKSGGPTHALTFCNKNAMSISNAYSAKYNTELKRVSDGNRNANNAPNEYEMEIIEDYKQLLKKGEKPMPRVAIDQDGKKNYYAPIFTGGVCLTCHGNPKNMQPEVVLLIDSLYPNDKAKGYAVDQIRGIWSVKFKNS